MKRDSQVFCQSMESRLVFFQLYGRDCADTFRKNLPAFQLFPHKSFQSFPIRSFLTPDPQRYCPGNQVKRPFKRAAAPDIHGKSQIFLSIQIQLFRDPAQHRKGAVHSYSPALYQCRRYLFRHGHGIQIHISPGRERIHRKLAVQVGGRGDHRLRAQDPGSQKRQSVRASDMSGQKRNRMSALLVDDDHRRIRLLAPHIRSDRADTDPRGAHKDQGVFFLKLAPGPGGQGII